MVRPVRVQILCRNAIVREGLGRILADNDFSVLHCSTVGDALNQNEHVESGDDNRINLIDIGFLEQDPDILQSFRRNDAASHIVILADKFDLETMMDCFRQGAIGYIIKEISSERLVATLRLVAVGEPVVPPQLIEALQTRSLPCERDNERPADAACLSNREFQILRWLIVGHPNKIISQRMDISEATVKVHVKSILRKLNVQNRTQAAIWAANHGVRQDIGERHERANGMQDIEAPQLPLFKTFNR